MHGVGLVTGEREVREFSADDHPQMMQALKVSLGSMGFLMSKTLKVLPDYRLSRRHYRAATDDCLAHLESLIKENRNFCFYWYPRRDDVSIRKWNEDSGEHFLDSLSAHQMLTFYLRIFE
ncbi:D-arabinono-1,4-lactone oxidase [Dyadobacter sp. CY312]|uniref:D-arabinono-1,4-lactone oxidase n=1 Tax=Dyadobacter sp. CY312 TaxID=2907303 RepID=UPI001F4609F6|nr:D-arabinono-1,4-lactone oxidase [Dyadobacter sp. CY312]MCE7039703.1 hypothetical protein [Dyadobacter sp. CY312]